MFATAVLLAVFGGYKEWMSPIIGDEGSRQVQDVLQMLGM